MRKQVKFMMLQEKRSGEELQEQEDFYSMGEDENSIYEYDLNCINKPRQQEGAEKE